MTVGTRELKNRLSHYLRRVREGGESIYVTDHGRVIAELRPVPKARKRRTQRQILDDLVASGDVSGGRGRFKTVEPIKLRNKKISIAQIVSEGRG